MKKWIHAATLSAPKNDRLKEISTLADGWEKEWESDRQIMWYTKEFNGGGHADIRSEYGEDGSAPYSLEIYFDNSGETVSKSGELNYLKKFAEDYFKNSIESCDIINSATDPDKDRRIREWYNEETFPEIDPTLFEKIYSIDWKGVQEEDVECVMDDAASGHISLDDVVSIDYAYGSLDKDLEESGYDGGYVFTYRNGDQKIFAWRYYPDNLAPLEEVTEYNTRRFLRKYR